MLTAPQRPVGDQPVGTPPARPGRRWWIPVTWLLTAWLVPLGTHVLRVDWLLVIVVVVGTAGLIRGGHGPLDRLVLSLALVYGALCVAGLLFSVWPWGLHPVPVAEFGLTVLVLGYLLTGRRFALPRRFRPMDIAVTVAASATALVGLWPLLRRPAPNRLALFMHVEDFMRHLMMYDAIRVAGGYLFLRQSAGVRVTGSLGYSSYPIGSHFVFAVTENFLRSTASIGPATTWADDFVWMHAASYAGMCLAALWGLSHVAGRAGARWGTLPVLVLGAAFLAFGPPVRILDRGYPMELAGLALVAVLVAITTRPLPRTGDQLVLVGTLLVGISFTYFGFLLPAGLAAAAWLVIYRRRVLARRWLALVIGVGTAAGCLVVPVLNSIRSDPSAYLLSSGQVAWVDQTLLVVLGLLVLLGLLSLRGPIVVLGLANLIAATLLIIGLDVYQSVLNGSPYYRVKVEHQYMVIVVVLLGALVGFRPVLAGLPRRVPMVVALCLLPVIAFGGVDPVANSPGRAWLHGWTSQNPRAGKLAYALYARYPVADDSITVLLVRDRWNSFLATLYLGIFQHNYGPEYRFEHQFEPWRPDPGLPGLRTAIAGTPGPVRVITDQSYLSERLQDFAKTLPPGKLTVLPLSSLPDQP